RLLRRLLSRACDVGRGRSVSCGVCRGTESIAGGSYERVSFVGERNARLAAVTDQRQAPPSAPIAGRAGRIVATSNATRRSTVYRAMGRPLDSFPVRKPRELTQLGMVVAERMAKVGLRRQVDLARAANVSESTVTRILYEDIAPDRPTLEA